MSFDHLVLFDTFICLTYNKFFPGDEIIECNKHHNFNALDACTMLSSMFCIYQATSLFFSAIYSMLYNGCSCFLHIYQHMLPFFDHFLTLHLVMLNTEKYKFIGIHVLFILVAPKCDTSECLVYAIVRRITTPFLIIVRNIFQIFTQQAYRLLTTRKSFFLGPFYFRTAIKTKIKFQGAKAIASRDLN